MITAMTGSFIRLVRTGSDDKVLINPDAISCVLPDERGSAIFFVGDRKDKITVRETVEQLAGLLDARDP